MIRRAVLGLLLAGAGGVSMAEAGPGIQAADTAMAVARPASTAETRRRWFVLMSLVNAYPRLEREQLIKEYFDPLARAIAPGTPSVKTFTDMRDEGLLWPPQFAIGYLVSDHLAISTHFGYSAGTRRTKSSEWSLLLVPMYMDFKIRRTALYIGLDLDYYPLGAVESREYHGFLDCMKSVKPALGTRLTWTQAGFDARIRLGFWPIKELLDLQLSDSWGIPSLNLNVGVDIPTGKNSVIALNAGYNFFQDQKQDFNGPAYTVAWRYFFR